MNLFENGNTNFGEKGNWKLAKAISIPIRSLLKVKIQEIFSYFCANV